MSDTDHIRADLRRFRLGEARVTTVLDGLVTRDGVRPPFCLDTSDAELQAIAAANRVPWDRFEHGFTPTLVETGGETVLIDAGFGAAGHSDGTGRLVERLGRAGVSASDVTLVVLTHVHPDHILGLRGPQGDTFPNARYAMGRVEFDAWKSGDGVPPQREKNREMFLDIVVPLADRMTFLEDGDAVVSGLIAEAAFGHSPGHMMYRLESGGRQVLIWGDVANHYVFSLRHPQSRVAFDDDSEQGIATRLRVLEMAAADGLMVIGHHMPFPSLGFVERDGESYRWVPETYQTSV